MRKIAGRPAGEWVSRLARVLTGTIAGLALTGAASAAEWDSIVGATMEVGEPTPHWFALRGRHIVYLVNGDTAEMEGAFTTSMFSPAISPQLSRDRYYFYGAFYSRTYYGERTDALIGIDARTMQPVEEVILPPKTAGIGHSGMMGMMSERFIGVWNITPAMSVTVVDVLEGKVTQEISTPGCAAVYPIDNGFLMPCGDGSLQYVSLSETGTEAGRIRSTSFFDIDDDPVFDYAVPTADGWMFMSLEGLVYEATVRNGVITIAEPWSILTEEDAAEKWRIGGRQPFAYSPKKGLLVTVMHKGGGQETFEDPGTELWGFNVRSKLRGYRMKLDEAAKEKAGGVQLTTDDAPLLIVSPSGSDDLWIHDALSGRRLRSVSEIGGGAIQTLE